MKTYLGLILLFCAFSALSGPEDERKSGTLMIRGRVPASTSIEWDRSDENSIPQVKFNSKKVKPKVEVESKKDVRRIKISHP